MKDKLNRKVTTWNPVTECSKVSAGCAHCYAEAMARRLHAMGQANYVNGFDVTLHPHMLEKPLHWRKPRIIFANSMSDMFHEDVPMTFVEKVFDVMACTSQHSYLIITKRAKRLQELAPKLTWPPNLWMGVTVENAECTDRIDRLRKTPAAVRFLCMEPLLSAVPDMDLSGIDWVIVGGESGPCARHMAKEWVLDIRDQCREADVPFTFKQWGGANRSKAGKLLDGKTYDEMPSGPQR